MSNRGLQPAGVDLQAKGFQKYLKELATIDAAQRKAFDDSGLIAYGKSYNQVVSDAKRYETQIKKTTKAQSGFNDSLKTLALGIFSQQTLRFIADSTRVAASFEVQRQALNRLAASYGQSGASITAAITGAANNTISASQAMQAANQGLLLGVAQTPEQFEELTRIALVLGRTLGLDATQALDQFTTALGRKSLLILDNFGISAKQVNAELDILAQDRFGQTAQSLNAAQRDALFLEAALKVAGEAASVISEESLNAVENLDRLNAVSENLKVSFGTAFGASGLAGLLADAGETAQELLAFISAGVAGTGNLIKQLTDANLKDILTGEFDFDTQAASRAAAEAFKEVARTIPGITFPEDEIEATTQALEENTDAVEENEEALKSANNALKQAEQLQLQFARAAEDSARKLERSQSKLAQKQAKARDKLLASQIKDLDDFESDRIKQISEAEKNIGKVRIDADKQRVKQQQDIQRQLKQAQDRFNLDRIQSQRRFNLADRRLVAEGDILGLQQLREDFALTQQENKENFNLQQSQTKDNTKEQLKELSEQTRQQESELQERLSQLKVDLEQERGLLLTGFDNQLAELEIAQAEQRQALLTSHAEQQEDARINQQRQLEDLGRALADEQEITAEGAQAIADELEKVFGQEGVADSIFGGFTDRTESEFRELFNTIGETIGAAAPRFGSGAPSVPNLPIPGDPAGHFDDGGVVGGSGSQTINAHGGETVLPTHKMNLPAALRQVLNVNVSGGIDVTGADNASAGVVDMTMERMLDSMEIAVNRMVRRG